MRKDVTETVDLALTRLAEGERLPAVLAAFPEERETLAPLLETAAKLEALAEVPRPDVASVTRDRRAFLMAAAERRERRAPASANGSGVKAVGLAGRAVSKGLLVRLKGWISEQMARRARAGAQKERNMGPILVRAALILLLAFGSIGGTVAVSADSLPGSPVYGVKLAVERARLSLSADPVAEADLHLAYAENRVEEMARVVGQGGAPADTTMDRLRLHLEEALTLCAQQPDGTMTRLLLRARQVVQAQEAVMVRAGSGSGESAQIQAQLGTLHELGQAIDEGLHDPQAFRYRHGGDRSENGPLRPEMEPGSRPVITTTHPVTAPHGYGPGEPGGNPDCVGECEPAGDQQQHQGPPPEPGVYGQELCPGAEDCEPAGDQQQYGPGHAQPGPGGEPGGHREQGPGNSSDTSDDGGGNAAGGDNDDAGGYDGHHGTSNNQNGGTGDGSDGTMDSGGGGTMDGGGNSGSGGRGDGGNGGNGGSGGRGGGG